MQNNMELIYIQDVLLILDTAISCLKEEVAEANDETFKSILNNVVNMYTKIRTIISRVQIVDAEPVRHGRWVYDPNGMDFNLGAWVCSECKERNNNLGGMRKINPYSFVGSRFCPNCGAKMNKKE